MGRNRSGKRRGRGRRTTPKKGAWKAQLPLVGSALFLVAGITALGLALSGGGVGHPDPRPDITADGLAPASRYAEYGRIERVYREAAAAPAVLDGLYCYCGCTEHAGHRSLYTCFETDHAAQCDVCLSEADLAYSLSKKGHSLPEIRKIVDGTYQG